MRLKYQFFRFLFAVACLCNLSAISVADSYEQALASWRLILHEYVDDQGRTDFKRLATMLKKLNQVVSAIANFGPNTAPDYFDSKEKILAYHINTYNALAMHGVIEEGIPKAFNSFLNAPDSFDFAR